MAILFEWEITHNPLMKNVYIEVSEQLKKQDLDAFKSDLVEISLHVRKYDLNEDGNYEDYDELDYDNLTSDLTINPDFIIKYGIPKSVFNDIIEYKAKTEIKKL